MAFAEDFPKFSSRDSNAARLATFPVFLPMASTKSTIRVPILLEFKMVRKTYLKLRPSRMVAWEACR